MKNKHAAPQAVDDEKSQLFRAVAHLMRESGFSDGFFSPEEQATFQDELESMELTLFKELGHERMQAVLRQLDADIKRSSAETITKKSLLLLKQKALKERVFTAALRIVRSGGNVVPGEVKYLERLREKFHFSKSQVEALVKKSA